MITVNGEHVETTPAPGQSLGSLLRASGHLTVEPGCDTGDCAACTVLLDGTAIHACIYPAFRAVGANLTTRAAPGRPGEPGESSGQEADALDLPLPGLLHLAVLPSPHASARIVSMDTYAARTLPGVHAVLTHRDSPATLFASARHENRRDDPDDTRVFDTTLRFHGQRVAGVVADSVAIAEAACRLIEVEYDGLPAVFDPDEALRPGAPCVHGDKSTVSSRTADPKRNLVAERHGERGDVAGGLTDATTVVSGRWHTQRVAPAASDTHATVGWMQDGCLVLRSKARVPLLVRQDICRVFDLDAEAVHVVEWGAGRDGGQEEILTDDVVALAVLSTGRPVRYEFTRRDEYTLAPVRHPVRVDVTLGATSAGALTALTVGVLADTGAYGNHAPGVVENSAAVADLYRVPNTRVDARCAYTNNPPSGASDGDGHGQVTFAIECALDDLARELDVSPFELRRWSAGDGQGDCLDLAEAALARGTDRSVPVGAEWRTGFGMASGHAPAAPPHGDPVVGIGGRPPAFGVQAFRIAVNTLTGEIRFLHSIQVVTADFEAEQARAADEVRGAVARAIGAALFEEALLDGAGSITTAGPRSYHVARLAELPTTEVHVAQTSLGSGPDEHGTRGAREAAVSAVAPALANAVRDAIGVRPYELPLSRDRIWRLLQPQR